MIKGYKCFAVFVGVAVVSLAVCWAFLWYSARACSLTFIDNGEFSLAHTNKMTRVEIKKFPDLLNLRLVCEKECRLSDFNGAVLLITAHDHNNHLVRADRIEDAQFEGIKRDLSSCVTYGSFIIYRIFADRDSGFRHGGRYSFDVAVIDPCVATNMPKIKLCTNLYY